MFYTLAYCSGLSQNHCAVILFVCHTMQVPLQIFFFKLDIFFKIPLLFSGLMNANPNGAPGRTNQNANPTRQQTRGDNKQQSIPEAPKVQPIQRGGASSMYFIMLQYIVFFRQHFNLSAFISNTFKLLLKTQNQIFIDISSRRKTNKSNRFPILCE